MRSSDHGALRLAEAVKRAYEMGETDYSLSPLALFDADGAPVGKIRDGDSVIFCCRRGEREIELTEAFTERSISQSRLRMSSSRAASSTVWPSLAAVRAMVSSFSS